MSPGWWGTPIHAGGYQSAMFLLRVRYTVLVATYIVWSDVVVFMLPPYNYICLFANFYLNVHTIQKPPWSQRSSSDSVESQHSLISITQISQKFNLLPFLLYKCNNEPHQCMVWGRGRIIAVPMHSLNTSQPPSLMWPWFVVYTFTHFSHLNYWEHQN